MQSFSPDPNKGIFTIQTTGDGYKQVVEIYNMLGEEIYVTPPNLPQGGDFRIDIGSQPNGIYLYRIISEDGSAIASGKFVVER